MNKLLLILFTVVITGACTSSQNKKEIATSSSNKQKVESNSNNLAKSPGYQLAIKTLKYFEKQEYSKIRQMFYEPIGNTIEEEVLKTYTDAAAELIRQYGIPNSKYVNIENSVSRINMPEITTDPTIEIVTYSFPMMPKHQLSDIPSRIIKVSLFPSKGYEKIAGFNVFDNTKTPVITPDFDPLSKFSFNISNFKRVRVVYSNEGASSKEESLIAELDATRSNQIKKVISLLNKAKIEKFDTVSDILRYNGQPETIMLHLNPYEDMFVMPEDITSPYFVVTEILNEEKGIKEEKADWILVQQFKMLTSSYLYFIKKSDNTELYNELKELKKFSR